MAADPTRLTGLRHEPATTSAPRGRRGPAVFALVAAACLIAGCLEKPEIEDRWTRIDINTSNLSSGQSLPAGAPESVSVRASITYRRIVTGFAVVELRSSATIAPGGVTLHPEAPRLPMANDIDRILQNSVSLGRSIRAVTGWDHLIQPIDFRFSAVPQATVDSMGVPLGPTTGLFLLCYLGSGERVELQGGRDSIIVTPFASAPNQLLPVGMELSVGP